MGHARVSRLRSAFRNAVTTSDIDEALANGTYGVPGFGSWGQGMVWQPGPNAGGVSNAMQLSAVWACLRILTDAISTLPLDTFERKRGTRVPYRPRPSYLDFEAPGLTRVQYLTQVQMSLLTDGNAFVATPRDRLGVPTGLVVLDPTKVKVDRDGSRVVYQVGSGTYSPLDIMHVPGIMLPGSIRGLSPIGAAREVVEGAAEAQKFGKSWFANAAVPPAVIKIPATNDGPGDTTRAKRVAQAWHETHGGTSNAGKVGVLTDGAELQSVAVGNKDSQWLESRQFSVQEIARIFGVPPHLIADSSNSTSWGSGLAEQNLAFGQFSLRPWIERIEDAHNRLLTSHGSPSVFMKLNLDALLRASLKDRYSSYATGIHGGFLSPNEARRWEDLPPIPGGDDVPPPSGQAPTSGQGAPA